MKMSPAVISQSTRSSAEKRLFGLLKDVLEPGWVAVHSLNLADHQYKRWGEADFILIAPQGVLVLEVKGGRVARNFDGLWEYTDRNGESHLNDESPFKQAEGAMLAVQKFLNDHLPSNKARLISYGHGVAFPDIEFRISSPEWASEQAGSSHEVAKNAQTLQRWIHQLFAFWSNRNRRRELLDANTIRLITDALRPQFEILPSLTQRIRGAAEILNLATLEQVAILDGLAANERIVITGGAGTGKTVLAAELARRALNGGVKRVGILAPRAQALIPYSSLQGEVALMHDQNSIQKVDYLIVDEAQDLMNERGIDLIDSAVADGYVEGRWAVFLDPNAQADFRRAFVPEAYQFLLQANHALFKLTRNLRNTNQIAAVIRDLTNADIGINGGGNGPEVEFQTIIEGSSFASVATRTLAYWLQGGIKPEECVVIVLGGEYSINELDGQLVSGRAKMRRWAESMQNSDQEGTINIVTPESYQGLEALCAIVGPCDDNERESDGTLYVALSRAVGHLVIVGTDAALAKLARLGRSAK